MKHCCIGLFAHVDAGKTTLSEALLYQSGAIRTRGRVDHGDAFLDTDAMEKRRGITIFSKEARFATPHCRFTLVDTPGHTDFSAEAERTLAILDCAVLVLSGTDGVQSHTLTLWRLLRRFRIPTFLFVNKTDLPGFDKAARLAEAQRLLSPACVDFTLPEGARFEAAALADEDLLEAYTATGTLTEGQLTAAVAEGRLFPCCFGSALRGEGVDTLLALLDACAPDITFPREFSARVFRITRDEKGNRLTHLKITGGTLAVRESLAYLPQRGEEALHEKVSQIRLYSGTKYETVPQAEAGEVCAVTGLSATYPGQGLGEAAPAPPPRLESAIRYRVVPPADCDARALLPRLRRLEEEFPQLHVEWEEQTEEIRACLAGKMEIEVFCHLVAERFGVEVTVDAGQLLYRETIAAPVTGVGHFEPLRHYAEVVVRLEPLPQGSGLQFVSRCPEALLSSAWQQTILTKLSRWEHRGVLTGAPLTDVRIVLLAGRAHPKHTEGGDFREAARRAVRQALMHAENVLLEPMVSFTLAVPFEQLGRAITDLHARDAVFSPAEEENGSMVLRGRAALSALREYAEEVALYTHGAGRIGYESDGYAPCREQARVVEESGYDPLSDLENPADSVFCAHGAGVVVPWNEVEKQMHLAEVLPREKEEAPDYRVRRGPLSLDDRELAAIFAREFGPERRPLPPTPARTIRAEQQQEEEAPPKKEFLLLDGYNLLFSWEELRSLLREDFDAARARLLEILINYTAYRRCETVCVFDAYRVAGHRGERFTQGGVHVVYTAEGETGDLYLERLVGEIGKNERVRLVTSDGLIQLSALRSGVLRVSAREFEEEVRRTEAQIREEVAQLADRNRLRGKTTLTIK